jgi:hypothetical protein
VTDYRAPWDFFNRAPEALPPSADLAGPSKRRGRRPASDRPPNTAGPFLYFHLTVSGPAPELAAFVTAACGAGVAPWRHDFSQLEEDVFHRAMAVPPAHRNLSLDGCRILARQFRDRVEAHHARAAALVGRSQTCPFDLHALLPVPHAILQRGPADPAALAWLARHWGVTERLRHVARRPGATAGRRLPAGHGVAGYSFFTDGETPSAAIAQLATRFTALRFLLRPHALD